MTATRACIKGRRDELGPSLEHAPAGWVYVGRTLSQGGWRLNAHPLANPHKAGRPCKTCGGATHTQPEAVDLYREHLADRPDLLALVPELHDATLCCWCKPTEPCHADMILELLGTSTDQDTR